MEEWTLDIESWLSKKKNANIRLKSVFQNLFNILEAISNTSNRGFPEIQALQSWCIKNLAELLLGVLIADKKKEVNFVYCIVYSGIAS